MNALLLTMGFVCLWAVVPSSAIYRIPHWDPSMSSTGPYNPQPPPRPNYARIYRDAEDLYQLGYYEQPYETQEARLRRSPGRGYDPGNIGSYGSFNPKAGGPRLPTRLPRDVELEEVEEFRVRRQIDGRPRHTPINRGGGLNFGHRF